MLRITPIFASLLSVYYVYLAVQVVRLRKANKVSLGSGGVNALEVAIRTHGNFSEYVPLSLLMLALLEFNQGSTAWLIALGTTLTLGRVLHAHSLQGRPGKQRVAAMMLTFFTLISLAVSNLVRVIF